MHDDPSTDEVSCGFRNEHRSLDQGSHLQHWGVADTSRRSAILGTFCQQLPATVAKRVPRLDDVPPHAHEALYFFSFWPFEYILFASPVD